MFIFYKMFGNSLKLFKIIYYKININDVILQIKGLQ